MDGLNGNADNDDMVGEDGGNFPDLIAFLALGKVLVDRLNMVLV